LWIKPFCGPLSFSLSSKSGEKERKKMSDEVFFNFLIEMIRKSNEKKEEREKDT